MTKHKAALARLQRELDKQAPALPVMMLSYGLDGDDLYHRQGRTYTKDELEELGTRYQLIVLHYGDWPSDDSPDVLQLRWPEDEDGRK